jgi:hypothetical protein
VSSLWMPIAFEILGVLCLLRVLVGHRSRSPFSVSGGLQPWQQLRKRISLAAVGAGLMLAGLIILYVDLFPPARSVP